MAELGSSVWSDLSPRDGAAQRRAQGYLDIFTASKTAVQQLLYSTSTILQAPHIVYSLFHIRYLYILG